MTQQSTFQTLAKNFKALLLASVLYPLDRIQSVQQIKSTYSNPTLQNSPNIISQAIHYGRKSYFRGFFPFLIKSSLLTASARATDLSQNHPVAQWTHHDSLSLGFALVGYCLLYPLQIINLRMSVEVEYQRFYSNIRECGLKTFYRGFLFSSALFTTQLAGIKMGRKALEQEGQKYSEWQKIGLTLGLLAGSEILLYPLTTMKKLFQINGAIGHTDYNFSILRAGQFNSLPSLFRGLGTKLSNMAVYSLVYCWVLGGQGQQ